jgi:hypothetical protein
MAYGTNFFVFQQPIFNETLPISEKLSKKIPPCQGKKLSYDVNGQVEIRTMGDYW